MPELQDISQMSQVIGRHLAEAADRDFMAMLLDSSGWPKDELLSTVEGQIRYLDVRELKEPEKKGEI